MSINVKARTLGACLIFSCSPEVLSADINMHGFASIVAGQTLASDENLYGYDNVPSFRNDSLAAIQFNADIEDGLSATVQLVARGNNNYNVDAEWAYLTYEFNDSVQLSAGRIRIPFYRYSDYLDVRYTYPWIKVPQTVYSFELPGYDGLSLLVNSSLGSWDSTLQITLGTTGDTDFGGAIVSVDQMFGINWTMARDWLSLRAAYLPMKVSNANPGIAGLSQLATSLGTDTTDTTELVNYILFEEDPVYFSAVSAGIDYNDWLVDLEFIKYGGDTINLTTSAYYVSLGKRIGKFTPFATISHQETDDPKTDVLGYIPNTLSEESGAILRGALNGYYEAIAVDADLTILGVRYDFHDAAAFKVEYATQDDITGNTNSLFRVGIDIIF